MDDQEEKGHVFRVAKQMVRKNRDVVGGGCVKGKDGKIVVEEEKIKEVWRDYFEKLLKRNLIGTRTAWNSWARREDFNK